MLFENWKWVWRGSLNIVFEHPKIKNVIQTLINEISYQTRLFVCLFFFFFGSQLVFKYWKLFEIPYQIEPKLSTFASVSNLLVAKKKKKKKKKCKNKNKNEKQKTKFLIMICGWVPISSTGKVSDGCIKDLGFNPRLHQKLIGVLI